jgi:hypothetical protein
MPGANNEFDPQHFALLMGSFDTGNASEAEAMNAARLLRRSLAGRGLRLVDVIYRADVMQALDAHLQPVREESAELKKLYVQNAELAERLHGQEQIISELRQQATARPVAQAAGTRGSAHEYLGGFFAFATVMGSAALLFAGIWHVAAAVVRWFGRF